METPTPTLNESSADAVAILSSKSLLAVFILFIYTITSNVFSEIGFNYLHESGLVIILGAGLTFFVKLIYPEVNKIYNTKPYRLILLIH